MTSLPGAASTSLRALLSGRERAGRVVGVHPTCAYVVTGPDLVALESADALGLPCAVRLGLDSTAVPFAAVRRGDAAVVGAGVLRAGGLDVRVVRWYAPPRVRPPATGPAGRPTGDSAAAARLAAVLAAAPAPVPADLPPDDLAGRGPGLTPAGDDVLAGWLLAVHHHPGLHDPLVGRLDDLTARTTTLSAALLREAAEGRGVPPAVALADVLAGHGDDAALQPALDRLLQVGHTSGRALAWGLLRGARSVGSTGATDRPRAVA